MILTVEINKMHRMMIMLTYHNLKLVSYNRDIVPLPTLGSMEGGSLGEPPEIWFALPSLAPPFSSNGKS